jgi:hypothetical protein
VTPYPEGLARATVREHLWFSPCGGREMLVERDDRLLLYDSFCAVEKSLLMVLMGLNRIYHSGFKWMDQLIQELPIAPTDLSSRLKRVFQIQPRAGVDELHQLIEETFALVESHMPEVDTTRFGMSALQWFRLRRKTYEKAPQGLL